MKRRNLITVICFSFFLVACHRDAGMGVPSNGIGSNGDKQLDSNDKQVDGNIVATIEILQGGSRPNFQTSLIPHRRYKESEYRIVGSSDQRRSDLFLYPDPGEDFRGRIFLIQAQKDKNWEKAK